MTQNERREYLIRVLLSEVPQYSDMKIPDQEDGQKRLLLLTAAWYFGEGILQH